MDEKPKNTHNLNVNFDSTPVFYTDNINVTANEDGVVFDVMQRLMSTNNIRIVARIGMSREHAKKLVTILEATIKSAESAMQSAEKKVKIN
ncbi:hypothetical protein A3B45_05110 [Candidatus Daviesbacteria bacterium RIFCSPLOWO2_01_FULL_39_12]|uniref:DUF3467 domain-containing protein n=1 Tax=Candidatus Daviesbacteria bacterium RIFCSPLOWO2_01_FULL_39_12 TaxID=1797785 RepID=A0A1F5KUM0_9BACT|nr:MAG: hypothetical protein A3B45_05110 [Candidatus Daviesbacteria bacterium RIFCSPLOWO2_01_FULL_39_12]